MEDSSGFLAQKYPTKMFQNEFSDSTNPSDKSLGFKYDNSKYEP